MKINKEYTRGPWVSSYGASGRLNIIQSVSQKQIASINPYVNKQANARLISAAPDLVDAGEIALTVLRKVRDGLLMADCDPGINTTPVFAAIVDLEKALTKAGVIKPEN